MTTGRRVWAGLFVATILSFPVPFLAARVPSATKVVDVVRILKAKARATPEDLAVTGSEVDVVLTDLLANRTMDREVRSRAAWALGGYPGPRSRAVLISVASDRVEEPSVRASALIGYARVAGPGAVADLKSYLKDPNPVLRAGAARALGAAGGPDARSLLAEAIVHEEDLEVRLVMDKVLKEMEGRDGSRSRE